MAYKQVREILDDVQSWHQQLADVYDELAREASNDRVRLLLNGLRRHEEEFQAAVARYQADAADDVDETWIQYNPEPDWEEAVREAGLESGLPHEELVARLQQLDQNLTAIYRQLAAATAVPPVAELFESLAQMEERKEQWRSQATNELEQDGPVT
ncbi:MAG: hypothetical protein KY476_26565 [Planctomycetes bacterium]|nr:hypothetical protein [Planctomycetota bacterium]